LEGGLSLLERAKRRLRLRPKTLGADKGYFEKAKAMSEATDPDEAYVIKKSEERLHRKAVREVLQKLGLYEEWDTAAPKRPSGAEVVNRTEASDVAFRN
jgi:hypothetical protein